MPRTMPAPRLPALVTRDRDHEDGRSKDMRAGFTIDLWLRPGALERPVRLFDSMDPSGRGICVTAEADGSVRLLMSDGKTQCAWASDWGLLQTDRTSHVVAIVDGGPKIIMFVVDGVLCDGGEQRQFGWGRYSPRLTGVAGRANIVVDAAVAGLRIYNRALRISEAVGNFHAGAGQ